MRALTQTVIKLYKNTGYKRGISYAKKLENLEYTQQRVYKEVSMATAISRVFMNGNKTVVFSD